jgi:phosphoglycolate phosphatase-like HAD superfamily hydrolase
VKLVLFDIDGTLLSSGGAGRRAMEAALGRVFGTAGREGYRYDGKTDRQIVRDLMRGEGFTDEEIDRRMPEVLEGDLEHLEEELAGPQAQVRPFPGVPEILDALSARGDRVIGLLTGNIAPGAAKKLRAAGIDDRRFRVSAFGSDHEVREELPEIARQRARSELGLDLRGEALVIIGDTPADIACGRPCGARAIAVATGWYSVDDLLAHEPVRAFLDLSDTDAVMRAIDEA